jgi:hypothetical protein
LYEAKDTNHCTALEYIDRESHHSGLQLPSVK